MENTDLGTNGEGLCFKMLSYAFVGGSLNHVFFIWGIMNPACKVLILFPAKDYNYHLSCFYNKFDPVDFFSLQNV